MRGRLLEYVLLLLMMNVEYTHIQFRFQMNEVFKSEVNVEQELNRTKKNENSLINLAD